MVLQLQMLRLLRVVRCAGIAFFCFVPTAWAQDAASAAEGNVEEVSEADLETARLHFKNGVDLLQQEPPNYQDAYRQFELAYEKSGGSWKVLGNLGLSALKLERDGEALQFYQGYLEQGGDEIDPGERSHIERELLLIKGNMATVHVETTDPNARISVKREGSSVPTQVYQPEDGEADLGLRAGTLNIAAKSGNKRLTWEVTLAPGEQASHVFDFDAPEPSAEPPPVAAPAPTAAPEETPEAPSKRGNGVQIAGFVTAGVGVAALGGGLITGLMSNSKEGKANDEADDICIDGVCPASLEDDFDSAKSLATVANVLFISGGVLAATGVTLVIVGSSKGRASDSARLQLTPGPTLGGGALFASGHF